MSFDEGIIHEGINDKLTAFAHVFSADDVIGCPEDSAVVFNMRKSLHCSFRPGWGVRNYVRIQHLFLRPHLWEDWESEGLCWAG